MHNNLIESRPWQDALCVLNIWNYVFVVWINKKRNQIRRTICVICAISFSPPKKNLSAFNRETFLWGHNEELFSHADVHVSKIKLEHTHVHTRWWDILLEGGSEHIEIVSKCPWNFSYVYVEAIVDIISHTHTHILKAHNKAKRRRTKIFLTRLLSSLSSFHPRPFHFFPFFSSSLCVE